MKKFGKHYPKANEAPSWTSALHTMNLLRQNGHIVGGEALQSARNAITLRWKNGAVQEKIIERKHDAKSHPMLVVRQPG